MGYKMQLGEATLFAENDFFSPQLLESTTVYKDDNISMELNDVSLRNFHLMRGKQSSETDSTYSLNFDDSFYVAHFVLNSTFTNEGLNLTASCVNTYSAYYQHKEQAEADSITAGQQHEFLELAVQRSFLQKVIDEEAPYSEVLFNSLHKNEYSTAIKCPIMPAMLQCIKDLDSSLFTGSLQQLFLETKAADLFLQQVQSIINNPVITTKLNNRDISCLHEARLYIEKNYHTPCTIIDLAKIVGINQTKLKSGFKELFGTTVFGYVKDLQMEKARQLLVCEKLYVGEVADQIGYKHPQHFAAAFKRKFGILPSELKS
ncbi:helix-turn-helix transcriptional regulator [Haoranjiania flava]|uniref:AraC family transcriptional regulator n=1 Tax=Haoranjiania flava TaxID=1856322 RepID=A0AAE3LNW3_9BACT|nr:AraC family transcriptional regulator [Haoranjiania flava]MCU7692910.1 AraC family transcriptional regulator [Haoranjiania flava]